MKRVLKTILYKTAQHFYALGSLLLLVHGVYAQQKEIPPDSSFIQLADSTLNEALYKSWWRFSSNDSITMAATNYDDSHWKVVQSDDIDSSILNGIGWFRLNFSIDSSLVNKPIALSLRQKGASEIYLDGKLIQQYGTIKDKDSTEYFNPQKVPVIIELDSVGKHALAIRYARFHFEDNDDDYGFTLMAGKANEVIKNHQINDVSSTFFLVALGVFFLTLGILHFLFFLFYKQNTSNLWFSLFSVCIAGIWFSIFWLTHTTDPNFANKIIDAVFIFSIVACLAFVFFIYILLVKKGRLWAAIPFILACIILVVYFTKTFENEILFQLLVAYSGLYSITGLVIALVKKVKGAIILGLGFGFFLLSLFGLAVFIAFNNGAMNIQTNNNLAGQILAITLLIDIISIPTTMSIYQAWIFAQLNKDIKAQLIQVEQLSEITLKQEQEKKEMLENQNTELERKVAERTNQLTIEKQKSDDLLLNILPEEIATELKRNGQSAARQYNNVTVLFTDFVNFTGISEQMSPTELVAEIHQNFTAFDAIGEKHGLEKIKTIGDAYLAVCGLPNETSDHAQRVVKAALEINAFMKQNRGKFQIRIGIHSGPVVAGIVGVKKYAYDIWGDTVNTAARMEQSGEAGKINVSAATYELVKREFECIYRGKINAKNKGEVDMWFISRSFNAG